MSERVCRRHFVNGWECNRIVKMFHEHERNRGIKSTFEDLLHRFC